MKTLQNKESKFQLLKNVFSVYFSLSSEQKGIISSKHIKGKHSLVQWFELLDKLVEYDQKSDKIRPFIGTFSSVTLGITVFISIFAFAFAAGAENTALINVLIVIDSIIMTTTIIGLIVYFLLKRFDLANYLREFVLPLLVVLKEDFKKNTQVELAIDLRKKTRKDNQTSEKLNYTPSKTKNVHYYMMAVGVILFIVSTFSDIEALTSFGTLLFIGGFVWIFIAGFFGGKYPKIKTTFHTFGWLEIKGKMIDNSILSISISDEIRKMVITRKKRGASGKTKIKTKTKYKVSTTHLLKIAFPKSRFQLNHKPVTNKADVQIQIQEKPTHLTFKVKHKTKIRELESIPHLEEFLQLMAASYQQVEAV